jgi:hypothetical protein
MRIDCIKIGTSIKLYDSHWGHVNAGNKPACFPYSLPPTPTRLQTEAERKAKAKLKQQNVNFAAALGEAGEASEMILKNLVKLRRGVTAVRRLDVRKLDRLFGESIGPKARKHRKRRPRKRSLHRNNREVSGLWLEYSFGWMPLLSDIHGATQELSNEFGDTDRFQDRYKCHVVGTAEQTSDLPGQWGFACGFLTKGFIDGRTKERHRCKVRLDYVLTNPMLATASQLGLTNPMETAWELLPLSFLVDYIVPVGNFFSQLDAGLGWSFRGGTVSKISRGQRKTWINNSSMRIDSTSAVQQKVSNGSSAAVQNRVRLTRSVYGTEPLGLSLAIDEDPFKGRRVQNLVSLLVQAIR